MALSVEQLKGLDIASQRKTAGWVGSETSKETDTKNLEYAYKQGYVYKPPTTNPIADKPVADLPPTEKPKAPTTPTINGGTYDPNIPAGTTPTGATDEAKKANRDATKAKILPFINQGLYTPEQLSTSSGLDLATVNDAINNDADLSGLIKMSSVQNEADVAHQDFVKKMSDIANGSIGLTSAEQAQIDQATRLYQQARTDMLTANKSFEGSIQTSNIRSGRQEFMNEVASGQYKQAIDDGARKIQDLDAAAIAKVSELQQLFKENKYKEATTAYDELNKYLSDKSTQIDKIHKATVEMYDKQVAITKAENEAKQTELNQQKLLQEVGITAIKAQAPALANSLTGDSVKDEELINLIAKYYSIDPNIVKGEVQTYLDTKEKNAKAKTTTKTIKIGSSTYLYTYDDTGKVISKILLGGGSSSGGKAVTKNYTAISIPANIKKDLVDDIKAGHGASEVIKAYPEVSSSYIYSFYSSSKYK